MYRHKPAVIIPAHNEQTNILNSLRALNPEQHDTFCVVVVCNGCSDNTATLVKKNFPSVICENITIASKAMAIRHAESLGLGFPRIYLDADVVLPAKDIQEIIQVAQTQDQASLVVPRSQVDFTGCSLLVRCFYNYWYQTPYVKIQGYGAGVYALNQLAREQFDLWPDLIADDGYVRVLCPNIYILENTCAYGNAPKTWWQLVKIKARSKYGLKELRRFTANTLLNSTFTNSAVNINNNKMSHTFLIKINYGLVNLAAYIIAWWMLKNRSFRWLRDTSNR